MKLDLVSLLLSPAILLLIPPIAAAQIGRFEHIVVIVQENRTPDNLFQGLCAAQFGSAGSCSTSPAASQYNIQIDNWLNKKSLTGVTQPEPIPLNNTYDLHHSHSAFVQMCDADSNGACRMDGAADVACLNPAPGMPFQCATQPQFKFVDNSTGILNPYLELATQYGWANYMFQTNQGPSFPAHQYLFGGTSAPSAGDDAAGIFAAENGTATNGCMSQAAATVALIGPDGRENQRTYPCFEHATIPDLLPPTVTWRYYTSGLGLWTAPNAIQHICESSGPGGLCTGQIWSNNLDPSPPHLLDIANCKLRSLSWVIPTGQNSDHAGGNDGGGPSWVASIVNAVGTSTACDGGKGYWKNTAVFITWDDWGGWYDHEPPRILSTIQGDYERGFRVPLIVVSAYTRKHYINNHQMDFGSILRFIESNFGIATGALAFADARTTRSAGEFFDLTRIPRGYRIIAASRPASFFLNDRRPPLDPDDD
jgi:phospholipase C